MLRQTADLVETGADVLDRQRRLPRALPNLRLAVPTEELDFADEKEIYGMHELPVTW